MRNRGWFTKFLKTHLFDALEAGMKRTLWAVLGVAIPLGASGAAAQDQLSDACAGVPAQVRETCFTVAQAAESAQPQLGILIAGGNPTLGTASTGGVRLGLIPRASVSGRLNVVFARLPDIVEDQTSGTIQAINDAVGIPAPALGANVSIGLTNGISLAPTVGGFGSVELLGSVTWLPFNALGVEGFDEDTPDLSWGGGVRVGLLRESFTMPGVSVSAMYRRLGQVGFGDVCPGGETAGVCTVEGDVGEFDFDLTNTSIRAAVSKRLLGLGLTAGVGYDQFDSDVNFAVRYNDPLVPATTRVFRSGERKVDNDRWSAFLDASFTLLVGTIAGEIGWIQGSDPIEGFPAASDFDPQEGNFFGSLGVRISL